MTFSKFRSRKLFLILAFLLFDSDSYLNSLMSGDCRAGSSSRLCESEARLPGAPSDGLVWIVDERQETCLGLNGFEECGELNLWQVVTASRGIKLKHSASNEGWNACLGRIHPNSGLELRSCSPSDPFSGIFWEYDEQTGQLRSNSVVSRLLGPTCINNNAERKIQMCSRGYTQLKLISYSKEQERDNESSENTHTTQHVGQYEYDAQQIDSDVPLEEGEWKCPKTGQSLPRNLDHYLEGSRQVLVGAGLFSKTVFGMNFKVYNLGWYVDIEAARKDSTLLEYKDQTLHSLLHSEDFVRYMHSPSAIDRTLVIKLAMSLKRDLVVQGLVEELLLEKKNSLVLSQAAAQYKETDCPEGLEILFTWYQARSDRPERFEVKIGELVISLDEKGLGGDFFYQFFREKDPVSMEAKPELLRFFPRLLESQEEKIRREARRFEWKAARKGREVGAGASGGEGESWYQHLVGKVYGTLTKKSKIKALRAWQAQFNSLLLRKHRPWIEERVITSLVLCYLLLLILISMPPALLRKGARAFAKVKRVSMREFASTLQRTMSRSTSLVQLTRPASTDLKLYFK